VSVEEGELGRCNGSVFFTTVGFIEEGDEEEVVNGGEGGGALELTSKEGLSEDVDAVGNFGTVCALIGVCGECCVSSSEGSEADFVIPFFLESEGEVFIDLFEDKSFVLEGNRMEDEV
jgi:hypothetical protein